MTATKTRKKQQTELIKTVLQEKEDKKRLERENFLVTSIPVTIQAAYEPSLHHSSGDDHDEGELFLMINYFYILSSPMKMDFRQFKSY